MYNETPVVGNRYRFGDWKLYAVHDEKNIKGFFGKYRWLSNFHLCNCLYEGVVYPSSENAYQAAKVCRYDRIVLSECSPAESKKVWKTLRKIQETKEEWDSRRYDVMATILFEKFYHNKDLLRKLIETGDKYLEETNHWSDFTWGVDYKTGNGKNWLGIILMNIRNFWKSKLLE